MLRAWGCNDEWQLGVPTHTFAEERVPTPQLVSQVPGTVAASGGLCLPWRCA